MRKWILVCTIAVLCIGIAACSTAGQGPTSNTVQSSGTTGSSSTVTTFGPSVSTVTTVGTSIPTTGLPPLTQPITLPTTAPTDTTTQPAATVTRPTDPTIVPTIRPTEPIIEPTGPGTPPEPVYNGWVQNGDKWYYYDTHGVMMTNFVEINGGTYFFGSDGAMHTGWLDFSGKYYYFSSGGVMHLGWLQLGGGLYYMNEDGSMHTGWLDLLEKRYYFSPGGLMQKGWISVEGERYYMHEDGAMHTSWLDLEGKRYYTNENGALQVGWLTLGENKYYLQPNGVMARGMLEIDGVKHYFTSTGANILLVNPWNYVPEDYNPNLVTMKKYASNNTLKVDASCYDALIQMLTDCEKQSQRAYVCSAHRTYAYQESLFENRVQRFINQGYQRPEALILAAQVVAVPGTSEHHLGLAVDIVDAKWPYLEEEQEDMPAQKWLMAHCWEYGFILRYPKGTTEATGIIYEPWHYRYVGKELAKEIYDSGLTLEEYLNNLTEAANQ